MPERKKREKFDPVEKDPSIPDHGSDDPDPTPEPDTSSSSTSEDDAQDDPADVEPESTGDWIDEVEGIFEDDDPHSSTGGGSGGSIGQTNEDAVVEPPPFEDQTDGSSIDAPPPPPPPPVVDDGPRSRPEVKLIIDPEALYFFVVGMPEAGKSMMLASILYYTYAKAQGRTIVHCPTGSRQGLKGEQLAERFRHDVRSGRCVPRSENLKAASSTFPIEVHIKFTPRGAREGDSVKFAWVEMAGEDCRKLIRQDSTFQRSAFADGIEAYLSFPEQNMIFMGVLDPVESRDSAQDSDALLIKFLDHLDTSGQENAPFILVVSKWDEISGRFDNVEDYVRKEHPILHNQLDNGMRETYFMAFSVGKKLNDDEFIYDPHHAERFFNWFYQKVTGIGPTEEDDGFWAKFSNWLSGHH